MKRIHLLLPLVMLLTACPAPTPVTPPTPIPAEPTASNVVSSTPPPPVQAAQVNSSVKFCWNASADAVTYGFYEDQVQIGETSDVFYTVNGLVPGTVHSFYVTAKAFDTDDNPIESDPSNTVQFGVPVLSIDTQIHWSQPDTNYWANQTYTLLSTTNLASTNWDVYPYSQSGTNAVAQFDSQPIRFFRLRVNFGGDQSCGN